MPKLRPEEHCAICAGDITPADWYANIAKNIRIYECQIVGVGSDGSSPPFTYTIGLSANEHFGYELIVFGLFYKDAGFIINNIVNTTVRMKKPGIVPDGSNDKRWTKNLPVRFIRCDECVHKYGIQADEYYKKQVPFVQMVLPDMTGRFPGEPGYHKEYMDPRQPLMYLPRRAERNDQTDPATTNPATTKTKSAPARRAARVATARRP